MAAETTPTAAGLPDQRQLLAEIERDVREHRRSGAISAEFEAELDRAFDEVSPPGATGGGFDNVVDQAARHAIVDYDAPTLGSTPLRFVKRLVKQLTAWYLIFVGRQLVAFAGTTLRALRILGGRVDELERRTPALDPRVQASPPPVASDLDVAEWIPFAIERILQTPSTGRVLHADCGDGSLLCAVTAAGIDGYGTDARLDAGAKADEYAVEVRSAEVLDHLRTLPKATLRGIVLTHCVDRMALGDQLELVGRAADAVCSGGIVVIVTQSLHSWAAGRGEIGADLAVGRPLSAPTWIHLLNRAGFVAEPAVPGKVELPDAVAQSSDPAVVAIARELFPPCTVGIVARRE